jgi:WD40 repeat protein/serine/threonine protein kinase
MTLLSKGPAGSCPACLFALAIDGGAGEASHTIPATRERVIDYFGDYELIEEIARGGMGVVYRARQISLNRPVALKMILSGQLATPALKQRFHTEAEAAARLDHPNIVPIYEIGEHQGQQYLSMKLIKGGTLADVASFRKKAATPPFDKRAASLQDVATLIAKVARAVHNAHQRGVLHRDLKPTNILMDEQGEPHITDFGLAKLAEGDSSLTMSAAILGTPAYMPPEQAAGLGKGLTTAADIYSLGAILYELITGELPFVGETPLEVMRKVVEEEPTAPSAVWRRLGEPALSTKSPIDRDLETICLKCLNKDPLRRYGSAEMLADDLDCWRNGEPISARPVNAAEKLWSWCRRKPAFASSLFLILVLLLIVVIGSPIAMFRINHERQSTEHLLYIANINRAQAAWEQNNVGLVHQLLEETQNSPYRGFEWYYWQRLTHLEQRAFRGHLAEVISVAVSPDGQWVASTSLDRTVKVWELATGRERLTIHGHAGPIFSVAFSTDGQRLITGSEDKTARVWDAVSGRELLRLEGHTHNVELVAFSRDDRRIVTGDVNRIVRLWDATTGLELRKFAGHIAALSPDGRSIVTTGGFVEVGGNLGGDRASNQATLWDVESGRDLIRFKGHRDVVMWVAFSRDGQRVVTGSRDKTAKVWDTATGTNLVTLTGHDEQINSVAFSREGKRIVTASSDQTAKIWDTGTGQLLLTLKGHSGEINSATFSSDDRLIITAGADKTVKVWDAEASREMITLDGHNPKLCGLAFYPDGKRIVTGAYNGQVKVWDVTTGQVLFKLAGTDVAFSLDGRQIMTTRGWMKLWDAESGRELRTFPGHKNAIDGVAFSPDGLRIVTGSADKTAVVWDVRSGKEIFKLLGHTNGVRRVAFSPDGRRIVTGSLDGTARLWDATNGAEIFRFKDHGARVIGVTFAPNGHQILSGDETGTGLLWEMATGRVVLTLKGHRSAIQCFTFSPDSRRILTGSDDHTAKLWETATGRELLTLKLHQDGVTAARFSPDGQRIGTASYDGLARLWDAATPEQARAWREEERAAAKRIEAFRRGQAAKR